MPITIYTTPTCPYCRALKQFLAERNVSYEERDVSRDRAAVQELMSRTGQMGVPVMLIDGQTIIGFDRPRIEQALSQMRPSFGAAIADASKLAGAEGAYIGRVRPGSAAERLGLAAGDIITWFNKQPVSSAADLERALSRVQKGDRVSVSFRRSGKNLTGDVIF